MAADRKNVLSRALNSVTSPRQVAFWTVAGGVAAVAAVILSLTLRGPVNPPLPNRPSSVITTPTSSPTPFSPSLSPSPTPPAKVDPVYNQGVVRLSEDEVYADLDSQDLTFGLGRDQEENGGITRLDGSVFMPEIRLATLPGKARATATSCASLSDRAYDYNESSDGVEWVSLEPGDLSDDKCYTWMRDEDRRYAKITLIDQDNKNDVLYLQVVVWNDVNS